MSKIVKEIVQLIAIAWLFSLLSACNVTFSISGLEPNQELVKQAIALQLSQTQQQLSHYLELSQPQQWQIDQVVITLLEPLQIQHLSSFHVQGTYDLKLQLSGDEQVRRQNFFEIYLQRQSEGKTWRLARFQNHNWITYLINSF